jgi:type IV pilus assembly protein PilE
MITLAIIAILTTVAVASYSQYVESARRTDAKQALEDVAQRLERCYSQYGSYNDGNCAVYGDISGGSNLDSPEGHYEISLDSSDATSYTLQAAPKSSSPQSNDACGTFTLEHTGASDSDGSANDDCW